MRNSTRQPINNGGRRPTTAVPEGGRRPTEAAASLRRGPEGAAQSEKGTGAPSSDRHGAGAPGRCPDQREGPKHEAGGPQYCGTPATREAFLGAEI